MSAEPFLFRKVLNYDLVLVKVLSSAGPQALRAKVERIYSTGKGVKAEYCGSEIEFIHSPSHWGNPTLEVGERALLFVALMSGRLYEDAWLGHMVLEETDGKMYAIFPQRELWFSAEVPAPIRGASRQDPKRSYATAIQFDVMEAYLLDLIRGAGRAVLEEKESGE